MKKIHVLVTHSLGELDVVLPIFLELHKSKEIKIKIIIISRKIYSQYLESKIYHEIVNKLNIEIVYSQLYNKFDFPTSHKNLFSKIINKVLGMLISINLICIFIIKNYDIFLAHIIMNDASTQTIKNFFLRNFLFNILNKKNYVYHHGHAFTQEVKLKSNFLINKKAIVLLFDEICKNHWISKYDYSHFHLIGFPKFYKNWLQFIHNYKDCDINNEKYVVIYSRQAEHKYYMDIEKYNYLLKSSYESIRKNLPEYKIYIKTHPRENTEYLKKLIIENNMKNIDITFLHSSILAKNAFLIISFWTSSILESLSLKIPSIEYYIEADKFRVTEPEGSIYKNIGIHSISTMEDLDKFIKECINNNYIYPTSINKYFDIKIKNFLIEN